MPKFSAKVVFLLSPKRRRGEGRGIEVIEVVEGVTVVDKRGGDRQNFY